PEEVEMAPDFLFVGVFLWSLTHAGKSIMELLLPHRHIQRHGVSEGLYVRPDRAPGLPDRDAVHPDRGLGLPERGAVRPERGLGLPDRGPIRPDRGPGLPDRGAVPSHLSRHLWEYRG